VVRVLARTWEVLGAADFFTVELWSWGRLTRYHVFLVIRLTTRRVHIAGIIPEPDGRWMKQIGRNQPDRQEGRLKSFIPTTTKSGITKGSKTSSSRQVTFAVKRAN